MTIRQTRPEELDKVMAIYDAGREYMRQNGNMQQWINGYPDRVLIKADIEKGISYVAADENDEPACVFAFMEGPDPTYGYITDGNWPDDLPYSVIHRIAVSDHRKGIAGFVYDWCSQHCVSLRADTHRDNIPMQNSLLKNGFHYCGIIFIADGSERMAFQKNS